jgi:hypothetical protein
MSPGILTSAQQTALRQVGAQSRGGPLGNAHSVTLNFHPDRITRGRTLIGQWAVNPAYHSQFVTGTSNGGLTAHPGGDRWRWESRIFGGAYDEAAPQERPVYGALNLFGYAYGAAVRFGSAHLELKMDVLERTTFCYPDSVFKPRHVSTSRAFSLARLARPGYPDLLDDYVEAHVHGPVDIHRDAVNLVLDPSFRGTRVEQDADLLADAGLTFQWHSGFALTAAELAEHARYRGDEAVRLGIGLARNGPVTPAAIGVAAATGRFDLQQLKKLWHCLARYGYQGHHGEALTGRSGPSTRR